MSWRATAYVKSLRACPDGTDLTRSEKMLLLILSDSYNEDEGCAWPSMATLADDSLMSKTHARTLLRKLVAQGMIIMQSRYSRWGDRDTYEFRFVGYGGWSSQSAPRGQVSAPPPPEEDSKLEEGGALSGGGVVKSECTTWSSQSAPRGQVRVHPNRKDRKDRKDEPQNEPKDKKIAENYASDDPWPIILDALKETMTKASFTTWLQHTKYLGQEGKTIIVSVPSATEKEWLEKRLLSVVRKTAVGLLRKEVEVRFVIAPTLKIEEGNREHPDRNPQNPSARPHLDPSHPMPGSNPPRGP